MKPWLVALFACAQIIAGSAEARQVVYRLDPEASRVGFEVPFGQDKVTGDIPVRSADIRLDFQQTANSDVTVVLDTAAARANFLFATQALRSPSVLNTARYPTMTFRSERISIRGTAAQIKGALTLRGITRPVSLDAQLFRQRDTAPGDLSHLALHLSGSVSRKAFGATGWSDQVGDEVALRIVVRMDRSE